MTRPVASVNVRHAWIKTDVQMQTCFSGALERSAQQAAQRARLKLYHQEKRLLLKDSNSLAFYNLVGGTVLEAKQQERGGRKK